jgi:SAM-dependent methyltransferase
MSVLPATECPGLAIPYAVHYDSALSICRPRFASLGGERMLLRTGVPLISELDALKATDEYRGHLDFNRDFLARHGEAMKKYGAHWGFDPFKLWSRRWEYPFVARRLIDFCTTVPGDGPLRILDAGSGVTYFPYYICAKVPRARFIACDYDPSYDQMFKDINAAEIRTPETTPRVDFLQAPLQKLPLEDQSLDAICCISVLEHTDNYGEIVDEFFRVLKPGGQFVLTFDLSLDGRFTLPKEAAVELLNMLKSKFVQAEDVDLLNELDTMHNEGVLNTEYVKKHEPEYLPWSTAAKIVKTVQDFAKGYGFTGGFRSRTVFCLDARKPR